MCKRHMQRKMQWSQREKRHLFSLALCCNSFRSLPSTLLRSNFVWHQEQQSTDVSVNQFASLIFFSISPLCEPWLIFVEWCAHSFFAFYRPSWRIWNTCARCVTISTNISQKWYIHWRGKMFVESEPEKNPCSIFIPWLFQCIVRSFIRALENIVFVIFQRHSFELIFVCFASNPLHSPLCSWEPLFPQFFFRLFSFSLLFVSSAFVLFYLCFFLRIKRAKEKKCSFSLYF